MTAARPGVRPGSSDSSLHATAVSQPQYMKMAIRTAGAMIVPKSRPPGQNQDSDGCSE